MVTLWGLRGPHGSRHRVLKEHWPLQNDKRKKNTVALMVCYEKKNVYTLLVYQ